MTPEKKLYKILSWKDNVLVNTFSSKALRSHLGFDKTRTEVIVKYLTTSFGSLWFLNTLVIFIFAWIIVNLGLVPGIIPFDPYPFVLLLMIVVLFTSLLAVVVLISQNRQGEIARVRQQIDFEINVRAEHEITKILHMLDELYTELGIAKVDKELEQMKEKIDITEIKEEIELVIKGEKKG